MSDSKDIKIFKAEDLKKPSENVKISDREIKILREEDLKSNDDGFTCTYQPTCEKYHPFQVQKINVSIDDDNDRVLEPTM